MTKPFPLIVFAAVFAAVYLYGFVAAWTEIRYYPLLGQISLEDLPRNAGPAMGWYSWIVQGFVGGLLAAIAALAVPRKVADHPAVWHLLWIGPGLIVLITLYFEMHWFQGQP